jgi:hypothetical protein
MKMEQTIWWPNEDEQRGTKNSDWWHLAKRAGAEVILTSWRERKLHRKGEISGRMSDSAANEIRFRPLCIAEETKTRKIKPVPTGGPQRAKMASGEEIRSNLGPVPDPSRNENNPSGRLATWRHRRKK